jgi:hypothetical protein
MKRLYFTKDIKNLNIDINTDNNLILYKKGYEVPKSLKFQYKKEIKEYISEYMNTSYTKKVDNIIFIGLNKIYNPSTRIHPVFEYIIKNIKTNKISIDYVPFENQVWRLWFHSEVIGYNYENFGYSYAIETAYNKYIENIDNYNPCSIYNIKKYFKNINFHIDYELYFPKVIINEQILFDNIKQEYLKLKTKLFNENTSIQPIINGLKNFSKSVFPDWSIPQLSSLYKKYSKKNFFDKIEINRTELKIDEYLSNILLKHINQTNEVTKELYNLNRNKL